MLAGEGRCQYALVCWLEDPWGGGYYAIEKKKNLEDWNWTEGVDYKLLCDNQPHKVLKAMLKLLEEPNKC